MEQHTGDSPREIQAKLGGVKLGFTLDLLELNNKKLFKLLLAQALA